MKKVIVSNVKHIKILEFEIPEEKGVFLIVGPNGAGKTTLLVCLERIMNPLAFASGFNTPRNSKNVDRYLNSSISYKTDNSEVRFSKGNSRWVPSPRKNSKQKLAEFGFDKTILIKADSKRIDVTQEDIRSGKLIAPKKSIIDGLNSIFGTDKYNDLKILKSSNGKGRISSLFYVIKDGQTFYSEKRFSSGELAVVRLLEILDNTKEGVKTLILLDEAEMALHPSVQRRLFDHLVNLTKLKDFTVLISTHSTVLIRLADRNSIYLLEEDGKGVIKVINPCYPAHAIGLVEYFNQADYDCIFYVEDDMARHLLEHFVERYKKLHREHETLRYVIVPVGGFIQTIRMVVETCQKLHSDVKAFALLDDDVFQSGDKEFLRLYNKHIGLIKSLGCTPEVFIVDLIEKKDKQVISKIKKKLNSDLTLILAKGEYGNLKSKNPLKLAKLKLDYILIQICMNSGLAELVIIREIVRVLVDSLSEGEIKKVIAPILN